MKLKLLKAKKLAWALLLGTFSLCVFVHCDEESSGGEDESTVGEDDSSEEESSDEIGDEVEEETEVDKDLKGKCEVPNLTRLCCDGALVQFCTKDHEWSECKCDKDQGKWGGVIDGEAASATPEGNMLSQISFEWDETLAAPILCTPGIYKGTWKCPRNGVEFKGPVTMTLSESVNGEFLEITDGELTGVAVGGMYHFFCTLTGGLDRSSNKFEATAVDGVFKSPIMANGKFAGTLTGGCVDGEIAISGEWSLTDSLTNVTCTGPWSIALTTEEEAP